MQRTLDNKRQKGFLFNLNVAQASARELIGSYQEGEETYRSEDSEYRPPNEFEHARNRT